MSQEGIDAKFWERADAVIKLANEQGTTIENSKVSASLLYGVARFNAFVTATSYDDGAKLKIDKEEALDYFAAEYRKMLSENLDDYIENFGVYIKGEAPKR